MKQHLLTVLVTRQDDLSNVCEARRKKFTDTKNLVNLFTTENDKLNGRIHGMVKQIADRIPQAEKNNEDSNAAIAIASLENDRAMEIVVFFLLHNFAGSANGSCSLITDEVPAPAAGRRGYQDQETAHAHKIIASLQNQSESLYRNSSTPIELDDLQWTSRPNVESYRRHFLERFSRQNAKLRALGNYYAAKTSRYTIIQNRLLPCIFISGEKRKSPTNGGFHQSLNFQRLKESQNFRIILADKSNSIAEARSELKKIVIDDNSTQSEVERLRKENDLLGRSLRKAADLHVEMLIEAEENVKEKERLAEERRALEKDRMDLMAKKEKLKRSVSKASVLREKEQLLEETRRVLEEDKQKFAARKEVFERFNAVNSISLKDGITLLEKERQDLDQDGQKFAGRQQELEYYYEAKACSLNEKETLLEDQRRGLEKLRKEFSSRKETFEKSNEENASKLRKKEQLLEETRRVLEEDKQKFARRQQELEYYYEAKACSLNEKETLLEDQRRGLEKLRKEFSSRKETFEKSNEENASKLRKKEISVDQQRQSLLAQLQKLRQQEADNADSLKERERFLEQDYKAKADSLEEMKELMENRQRELERCQQELLAQRREFQEYYEGMASRMQEQERSLTEEQRALQQDRSDLSAQREELQQAAVARDNMRRELERSNTDGEFKIPIIQEIVTLNFKLPSFW